MEVLVTHQSWTAYNTHFAYIAPYKLPAVDEEGTLRLMWWPANEGLKSDSLPLTVDATDPRFFATKVNMTVGEMLEVTLPFPAADAAPQDWPGFLLGRGATALRVVMQPDGDCAVGELDLGKGTATVVERWTRDLEKPQPGQPLAMRLLFRFGMLEMYVNDVLYPIYSMHLG